ncbi:MAG: DASS family sodium-coupled anion symporter [Pseudomonadota bacterium]
MRLTPGERKEKKISDSNRPQPLSRTQRAGRWIGPIVFGAMLLLEPLQSSMSAEAWRAAAVGLWMATWWASEAIPLPATAMLPLVLFQPLGLASIRAAAAPYAHPSIFLFLGGFIMALALERWGLHRRIALAVLARTGTEGKRLIGGFMLVCAGLSMWMTNTSTTMMLLPIVLSVIAVLREQVSGIGDEQHGHFALALLLGLAFSASIGGLGTLIGTPPNALLVGYLADNHDIEISFARWMLVGIPVSLVLLPTAWWVLTCHLFKVNIPASAAVQEHLATMRRELGPMRVAERRVAIVFACLVAGWMLRVPLQKMFGIVGLSDTSIAIAAAIVLFLVPSSDPQQRYLMRWEDTSRLPWGVLVLFGGGLSLAAMVDQSGLALWLGQSLAPLNGYGVALLMLAAVTLTIFLTELTSNLATTATLLPVMGAIALQAGLPPLLLTVPVTIAASCAFMLPVATAPNAIVFSTGRIRISDMVRAGVWLNLLAIVVVWVTGRFAAPALLS